MDTIGTHLTVLIVEVSLIEGYYYTQLCTKASVHIREVSTVRGSTVYIHTYLNTSALVHSWGRVSKLLDTTCMNPSGDLNPTVPTGDM